MFCLLQRGLAAGIYTTNSPEACQYVAANCEANVLVVENQKQLDKILKVRSFVPYCFFVCLVFFTVKLWNLPHLTVWLCLARQVKDHLPHLKAIVQYKGELQQKMPFLYTVRNHSNRVIETFSSFMTRVLWLLVFFLFILFQLFTFFRQFFAIENEWSCLQRP